MKSFNYTISSINVNQFEFVLGFIGPTDNLIYNLDILEDGLSKRTLIDEISDNQDDYKVCFFNPNGLCYLRSFFKIMGMIEKITRQLI